MNATTFRILLVLFILAHGWIHMSLAQVPVPEPGALRTPFFPAWWRTAIDPAWPVSKLGASPDLIRPLGWVLWAATVALYTLSAAGIFFSPGSQAIWQGSLVAGSVTSLLLLGLYWHPWLPVGVVIDLALILAVILRWPLLQFGK